MNNICFIEFIASFARKKMQSRIQIFSNFGLEQEIPDKVLLITQTGGFP